MLPCQAPNANSLSRLLAHNENRWYTTEPRVRTPEDVLDRALLHN
jgi:hypothetical protein